MLVASFSGCASRTSWCLSSTDRDAHVYSLFSGQRYRRDQSLLRATVEERCVPEEDPRYRRVDLSEQHAWDARQSFVENISMGEPGINLAKAALAIAAEDDALVSHSTVPLPVPAFVARIRKLAEELARLRLPPACNGEPAEKLQVVETYLFKEQQFRLPSFGRSNVPTATRVDHPGVWENAKYAYLHEALISKQGTPAVLAILFAEVMQQLLRLEAVDFAVRIECTALDRLPRAKVLRGMPAAAVRRTDGSIVNTCPSTVLLEVLQYLKRAFWPFAWESRPGWQGSGFPAAAMVWLEGEESADLQAIARTAKHRLERGIWTSPGAGDLRRALASTERLVLMAGDVERRDLAVLQLHAGQAAAAAAELARYAGSAAARGAPAAEARLVARLRERLGDLGVHPASCVLGVAEALAVPRPELRSDRRIPLTW